MESNTIQLDLYRDFIICTTAGCYLPGLHFYDKYRSNEIKWKQKGTCLFSMLKNYTLLLGFYFTLKNIIKWKLFYENIFNYT